MRQSKKRSFQVQYHNLNAIIFIIINLGLEIATFNIMHNNDKGYIKWIKSIKDNLTELYKFKLTIIYYTENTFTYFL